jgi:hypothetical protein
MHVVPLIHRDIAILLKIPDVALPQRIADRDSILEFIDWQPSLVAAAMHAPSRKASIENGGKPVYIILFKLAR